MTSHLSSSVPLIAILLVAALTSCTAPRQPSSRAVVQTPPRSQPTAQTATVQPAPEQPKDFFTVGSSMDEVAALMGTPSRVNNFRNDVWWYYGHSRIVFRGGRVTEWDNTSNNLKVRWSASSAPPQARTSAPQQMPPASYGATASPPAPRRSIPRGGGGLYVGTGSGHWIQSKSDDGDIITLEDGSVWQVDQIDRIDTMLWLPITDITVTESGGGYLLINTDDGEKAHATLLRQ